MTIELKRLSLEAIERSPEIQRWLENFTDQRTVAMDLLLKLRFVSRDTYSEWLKQTVHEQAANPCALIAVRKLDAAVQCLWDADGNFIGRDSASLGSEDLVNSVIAGLVKSDDDRFLDHPHLDEMRERQVHEILLIEDSIASGQRVIDFVTCMFRNRRIMSWWSFGYIRLRIIAFARMHEAQKRINKAIPGSNHLTRRFRKSDKIDNLPGVLWYQSDDWNALFPKRSLPDWLPALLDDAHKQKPVSEGKVSEHVLSVLQLSKRGVRNDSSIAWALGLDGTVTRSLLMRMRASGLLSERNRLTEAGRSVLKQDEQPRSIAFDHSLYVPQSWCADRETVQPPQQVGEADLLEAESNDGSPSTDGEVG